VPDGVLLKVVTTTDTCAPCAPGVADAGVTEQSGIPTVCTGVTAQGVDVNETASLSLALLVASSDRFAVEDPPGFTGPSGVRVVSVNCPYARPADAAENTANNNAKKKARTSFLELNMRG
jgi:hypothetical protein